MFGLGVLKGLGITLKHFVSTFVEDLKYFPGDNATGQEILERKHGADGMGLFTVQYPEMKLAPPENFRFLPFLVTDYDVSKEADDYEFSQAQSQARCTSCGICAKVCPPQCIWIVRTNDPKTGKPIPQPSEFYIDTDICMNCGYCAEFCPFDAIKMDHDFEIADYNRAEGHVHDIQRLLQPVSYYASIRPTWNAQEEEARRLAEEEKQRKAEAKKKAAAERAAKKAAAAKAAEAAGAKTDTAKPSGKRSPEEIKVQREAMMAKRAAKKATGGDAPKPEKKKRTPEEIKAQREAMMAKRAAKAAGKAAAEESPKPEKKKRTPEEIKAQREAMMAKRAARQQGSNKE